MDPAFTSNLRRTNQHAFLLINHHTSLPNPQTNFPPLLQKAEHPPLHDHSSLSNPQTNLPSLLQQVEPCPLHHPTIPTQPLAPLQTLRCLRPPPLLKSPPNNNHARVQPPNHHPLRPPRRLRSTRHGLRHVPHIHVATRLQYKQFPPTIR